MKKHLNIEVSGKVQGVFYRASALEKAEQLDIVGIVKNLSNGDVYIECEGEDKALSELVEWCKKGPSAAIVKKVEVTEGEIIGYKSFEIRR